MDLFSLTLLLILVVVVAAWTCQTSMEPFLDTQPRMEGEDTSRKMRPWFGYEPGYGPGWGRSGCCDVPVPFNMGNA